MARKSIEDRAREVRERYQKSGVQRKVRRSKLSGASRPLPCHIYFIQVGTDGPIKVGRTRCSPLVRMDSLQIGIPFDLRLRAVIIGVQPSVEIEIHRQFTHLHIRGEWFRPEPELLDFIDKNALPWKMPRGEVPAWWFGIWDLRSKTLIEEAIRNPEARPGNPEGDRESYDESTRLRAVILQAGRIMPDLSF